MEKYGVHTESNDEKTADDKQRERRCPVCGEPVVIDGNVYRCLDCGSKPFETP